MFVDFEAKSEQKTLKKQTKIVADGLDTAKLAQGRAKIAYWNEIMFAKHSHVGEIDTRESGNTLAEAK